VVRRRFRPGHLRTVPADALSGLPVGFPITGASARRGAVRVRGMTDVQIRASYWNLTEVLIHFGYPPRIRIRKLG